MKVSKHFTKEEITCRCGCNQAIIDIDLYEILESFRSYLRDKCGFEVRLITHCVNRCVDHNRDVGGVDGSHHVVGSAWDGHGSNISNLKLRRLAKKAYKENIITGGLGFYKWGIHIDSSNKRTWKDKNYKE
jgi:uncharacterized protein YcbK (DUF882 family)